MKDLIYRQATENMIKNHKSDFSTEKDFRIATACISAVPSAQPSDEYERGWKEGRETLREETWEDGRDRLD